MSIQQPSTEWDDTIDLRKWIDALFHYKWLILTCALVAAVAATTFGYVIQTPTFEATGGATLPSADGTNGLGLTLRGYQEFATSTPVMGSVGQKLGRQTNAGQLRGVLSSGTACSRFAHVAFQPKVIGLIEDALIDERDEPQWSRENRALKEELAALEQLLEDLRDIDAE